MAGYAVSSVPAAESGVTRYFREIGRFPILEPEDEYMLAERWRRYSNREAAHRLVTSHLRLVARIAVGYRGYGLPIAEIISEGNVGLMKAVAGFEPERGFRLATYAMWWIRASIQEYVLRSWSLVRMGTSANQKKLFFNLSKAKAQIAAFQDGHLRADQMDSIAKKLGVSERDVIDMNCRLSGDVSLNAPISEGDAAAGEWQDWLLDDAPSQELRMVENETHNCRRKALSEALTVLDSRERRILEGRRLASEPAGLADLAKEFGISRERVRQIEVRAFVKLRDVVRSRVAAMEQPRALVTN